MTGRELVVYILTNNLENEEVFSKDGIFIGFMDEVRAAEKFNVGIETIRTWYIIGYLKGFIVKGSLFIPKNAADPRLKISKGE